MGKMEVSLVGLQQLNLFPFVSRLLSVKYSRISYFVLAIYLLALSKVKLKMLKIKSVDVQHFKDLIARNTFDSEFIHDITKCALISMNTLIALSLRNASWIKVQVNGRNGKGDLPNPDDDKFNWKIVMPQVTTTSAPSPDKSNYYIQCVCLSSVVEDFTMYVTDVQLHNISKLASNAEGYHELVNEVNVETVDVDFCPTVAKIAVVAPIATPDEMTESDFQTVLEKHFEVARLLRVGDVFQVNIKKCLPSLKASMFSSMNLHFQVIKFPGDSDRQIYYVSKDHTSLYLNSPVHGYLPQVYTEYVDSLASRMGTTIPLCPEGLLRHFHHLRALFRPFLDDGSGMGIRPMFLLCGPSGTGKKTVLKSAALSYGLHVIHANCHDLYGLNPSLVKGKFNQVFAKARRLVPCVIHMENVEVLGRGENHKESARLIDILERSLKDLWDLKPFTYPVYVVGTTDSKVSDLVPAVSRLFIETITFEAMKFEESLQTLRWLVSKSGATARSADLTAVAEKVKGYVYNDFILLVQHAVSCRLNEPGADDLNLTADHFNQAIAIMDAAYSDAIGAARVPTVQWDDVGGLGDLKEEIMLTLNMPLKHPEMFASGLKRSGILFYGPPGTGKTLMAKAIATECNYTFLSVKGPELMNMYVGQSEKNVREVFEKARDAAPCIIFFDELDSLAPARGKGSGGGVTDRVVSQLLAEMDGLDKNRGVFVLGATNRPDLVDAALLRPGRFDKLFYVGVCTDKTSKLNVLKALTRKFVLDESVDLAEVVDLLPGDVTGADLYSVSSNAWFSAARKCIHDIERGETARLPVRVTSGDFVDAVSQFVPSLTADDIDYYKKLQMSVGR